MNENQLLQPPTYEVERGVLHLLVTQNIKTLALIMCSIAWSTLGSLVLKRVIPIQNNPSCFQDKSSMTNSLKGKSDT